MPVLPLRDVQRALHVAQWKHWHSSQVTLTPLRLTV
jgi:hypothetical protein